MQRSMAPPSGSYNLLTNDRFCFVVAPGFIRKTGVNKQLAHPWKNQRAISFFAAPRARAISALCGNTAAALPPAGGWRWWHLS
jgi:hypothetical protein